MQQEVQRRFQENSSPTSPENEALPREIEPPPPPPNPVPLENPLPGTSREADGPREDSGKK